jgi:hypothetical protein
MPFVEIGMNPDWVNFTDRILTISMHLRKNMIKTEGRVRLFYDDENQLFAIKEDSQGYKLGADGRITTRRIKMIEPGRYFAEWNMNQIMVDLTKKIGG